MLKRPASRLRLLLHPTKHRTDQIHPDSFPQVFLFAFTQTDFTRDPFESGVAVEHFDVILISNLLDKFGSNDSLHTELITLNLT